MEKVSADDVRKGLFENVTRPVFTKRCEERGIEFTTEEELEGAMKIAAHLVVLNDQHGTSLVKKAHAAFEALMEEQS